MVQSTQGIATRIGCVDRNNNTKDEIVDFSEPM